MTNDNNPSDDEDGDADSVGRYTRVDPTDLVISKFNERFEDTKPSDDLVEDVRETASRNRH